MNHACTLREENVIICYKGALKLLSTKKNYKKSVRKIDVTGSQV